MSEQAAGKDRKLLIVGDSAFAEVAWEYFTHDSPYEVAAFAVERPYLTRTTLFDRPVVALEDAAREFPPQAHDVYVAVVYSQLNRLRARLLKAAREAGYRPASYISPRAFVAPSARVGEHCFIFESNVVQSFVTLGDNVVLWSGNHIGHHSRIGDNVFVSSHVVISGFCDIGANCFLGVNVSVANNLTVANDCWIGPGVVISKNTKVGELYRRPDGEASKVGALRFFKIES
jgi:sugar O-acyltransferase (sialic acid O-acetyltransferase NeuD family)